MTRFGLLKDQLTDFPGFMLGIKDASMKSNGLRNPFDIPRHSLLDQLVRMRANFLQVRFGIKLGLRVEQI